MFTLKRSGILHIFTLDVDPGYKYIEIFRGAVQWYMLESEDFFSSNNFQLKKENKDLVSINGQSLTFRLSTKEVYFLLNDQNVKRITNIS